MALDLTAIRKALADNAATAADLDDAKHYRPDTPHSGTSFWLELVSVEPSTIGARVRWTVELEGVLWVQGAWDRSKQEANDRLIPNLWTALESDRTAGGNAQDLAVMSATILRDVEDGAPLGVRFDINVEA